MPVYKNKNNDSWFIKTYIKDAEGNSKQITKRNKEWIGKEGKIKAHQEEIRIKNGFETNCDLKVEEVKKINNIAFSDLLKIYKEELFEYNKESTLYGHSSVIQNHILPTFGEVNVCNLKIEDIINWHKQLDAEGLSYKYKKKCHTILSCILDMGVYFGSNNNVARIVGNFKKERIEKEKVKDTKEKLRYITLEDFKKFISVVNDDKFYVYFNLLYFTGMRKGEIQALNWNDIDFKNNKIKVTKTLTVKTYESRWKITSTKNLKNRTIDIDNNLKKILYNFFNKKKKEHSFSMNDFLLGDTEPLKQTTIDTHKRNYFKISGISEITNHEFRHSHVSLMINEYLKSGQTDASKFFVIMSNRLGHTIKVMQDTYLHFFPDVQAPIVDIINNLNF